MPSLEELYRRSVEHLDRDHASKNLAVALLTLYGFAEYYSVTAWAVVLAVFAPLGHWIYEELFDETTVGASGGTFALLGTVSVAGMRRFPLATTVGLAPLAYHQVILDDEPSSVVHIISFVGGAIVGALLEVFRE